MLGAAHLIGLDQNSGTEDLGGVSSLDLASCPSCQSPLGSHLPCSGPGLRQGIPGGPHDNPPPP